MLFIDKIESDGFNLDFVVLKDGRVLGVDGATVVLYSSMKDFEEMRNVDRQSIDLSTTPALIDQIATLVERVAKLEAHATTRARDIRDAINHALDTHDFSDDIARKIDDYDFSDAIGSEVDNHDFSDAINNALDNHDLTTVIEETLRGKTITIR